MIVWYYKIVIVAIFVGAVLFPVMYHKTSRWWSSQMGRYLMGSSVALALVTGSGVLRIFFPDLPGQEPIRMLALSAACFFVWHRIFIYIRVQRERTES